MGNKAAEQTKRHASSQQTERERQSQAHTQAMAQISLEQTRIQARAEEAKVAMQAERNRLEAEAKQAELQMQKEKQEREDALKKQDQINKENDKEKKREQRQAAINDITTKLTTIPEKINMEREKLKMVKADFGDTTEKLNEIEAKLKNWDQFKEQHLSVFKDNVKDAKHDYERDDEAIKDAVNSTGVHEENVNRFLVYTHNLINATVSTTHATNKLQTKISTFGELISRLCQTKLSIEGYFTDVVPKLKPFIQILSVKGFTYMDELKCKSTDEFEKDIFPMLEKGIVQQKIKEAAEKKDDNIAETNEEKKEEPEKSFKELLTEWKLAKYIDKFEEEGWDDPRDYKDMEADDLKDLGLNKPAIKKFERGFKKWSQGAAEEDELIGLVQKRQLQSICLESAETWEKDAKTKQREVKKGLMVASPLLGGFFGTIDVAVKQAQNMLEYNDALNEKQVKAIEMIKEDEKKDDSKSERVIRESWDAQSKCEIFSDSAQKWYDGTIIKITHDKEGEWLNIAYRTGDDEKTPTLKQIQRFAKGIKPKEDTVDAVEQKNDELMKVQKNCSSLTKAAIIEFHIVEDLKAECLGDSVKLMALDVADGVEKGCVQIFKSAGTIRKSVFLAQSILQLKPANMEDKTRKQLWSAVDNGIINIYSTALQVAKVSEKYFNYFVRFKQSFGFFMQCYKGKNEKEQEEMALVVCMEYLQKDIREFDAFQQNFLKTVTDLEAKSLNVIAECVKTTIGAEEFEKSRNSRKKTKETYLQRQKDYDDELAKLNQKLDDYWDEKIKLAPKHSSLEYQSKMLSKSIEQNETYVTELERRLENIQKTNIELNPYIGDDLKQAQNDFSIQKNQEFESKHKIENDTQTNTNWHDRMKHSKSVEQCHGDENETTALENEIVRNEKQYQLLLNDTSKLEAEIICNERLWRKYIVRCSGKNDNQPDKRNRNEQHDNQNNTNNNPNNNNNNNNGNNDAGGDEKKDDEKKDEKKDNEDDDTDDEEELYNMSKLKEKIKIVKGRKQYKVIQRSSKHRLNENELMAVVYYCDSKSGCRKMKKAHRCIIKDLYWQETYYHCTHAIEKIYQVLHYKNKQFKQENDMSQKLYHGSQEEQLNGYDKDQFFLKTITSFSTKTAIATGFAKHNGMMFIIDKAFEGLYNGDLRGANVQWVSNFDEYEYVILPTTYNNISECKDHGLSLAPSQNVYITSLFKTNEDPLKPHSDTVSTMMQISYTQFDNKTNNNFSEQLERKYESDYLMRNRRRDIQLCHIINCDFEHADTIPSTQLDTRIFDDAEIQHVYQCHPNFYLRLTTYTNTTENDMNKNIQWSKALPYVMQITYIDPELTDFHLRITANEVTTKRRKIFIKRKNNDNGNTIAYQVTINKGKRSAEVDIEIDEKHDGVYWLGVYDNKHAEEIIPDSNNLRVLIETDDNKIPPKNVSYYPRPVDLETIRVVKDRENETINVYWDTPLETYGEIKYKILNHINEIERETISMLPYSIPLYCAFLPFKVCTIATIDEQVYESKPSQSVYICGNTKESKGHNN